MYMRSQRLPDWKTRKELSCLFDLPNPPKELFYIGTWNPALFARCTAIVGSRRMTEYGKRVIENIVPRLVFEKKTIVSGFMYGVDQYAHQQAIENGGKTIAVLGWGIQRDMEERDKRLAYDIVKSGGLLLSEWEDQAATLWTFPVRNRIVAALSEDVVVVEAGLKSGSLITATIARRLKRRLWAVPGPITSTQSKGTNMLIDSGHARMWLGDTPQQVVMSISDDPIIRSLTDEELTASELARKLEKPVADIGAQLSMLAITGQVIEKGGKYSARQN